MTTNPTHGGLYKDILASLERAIVELSDSAYGIYHLAQPMCCGRMSRYESGYPTCCGEPVLKRDEEDENALSVVDRCMRDLKGIMQYMRDRSTAAP